jgi:putative pyoverdin transport system ATP-binding/permease protein
MTELIRLIGQRAWWRLLIAAFSGMVAGVSYAAIAAIINRAVRGGTPLILLGWSLLGTCVMHVVMRMLSTHAMLRLSQEALYQMRLELCRRLLATPQETLQALGKPRLLAIVTRDVDTLSDAYQALIALTINAVIIGACLIYLGRLYWPLLVVFSVFLVLGVGGTELLRHWPMHYIKAARERLDGLYAQLRNLIEGSRELQLNRRRGRYYVEQVIASQAAHIRDGQVGGMVRFSLVMSFGDLVYFASFGVLLFVLPHWLTMPPGTLANAVIILLFVSSAISEVLRLLPSMSQARVALDKIQNLEKTLPGAVMDKGAVFAPQEPLHLELQGIQHRYKSEQDRHFVLGPLDLNIHGGEIVFVVGGNGSGKSTLGMILLGLYRADEGEIRLNGSPLNESNREHYRQHFSAVLADFHLFEEISSEQDPYLEERARSYIKALRIDHKVSAQDGKFSNVELSSGQRKRLALVSAYLEDRPAYLFDEWAADQDPEFKRIFYTRLLPDLRAAGKAVIVITHDDAYFEYADRVLRLEEGQIEADAALQEAKV